MTQTTPLSTREKEVVRLLLQGKSNKLIALALGISDRTVEFHLKNIYAKQQVSSRVELILQLGKATGEAGFEKLGTSTVVNLPENAENNSSPDIHLAPSHVIFGQEFAMKTLLKIKHILVGIATALFVGFMLRFILSKSGEQPTSDQINTPMTSPIILPLMGLVIGLVGRQTGRSLQRVFLCTLTGAGLSLPTVIPLTMAALFPIVKINEQFHLIDTATLPGDVASQMALIGMSIIWLVSGCVIGMVLLFVSIQKPAQLRKEEQRI